MSKVVLPISGGMDSTVLLHRAAAEFNEVHCLTFNYNQRHSKEIEYAKIQIELAKQKNPNISHQILDVSFIRELAPTSSLTNDDIDTPNVKHMCLIGI
jgi:7-cyano-7-deazaguanine synthase